MDGSGNTDRFSLIILQCFLRGNTDTLWLSTINTGISFFLHEFPCGSFSFFSTFPYQNVEKKKMKRLLTFKIFSNKRDRARAL